MIGARTVNGLGEPGMTEKLHTDLVNVTLDFSRAMNVEALRRSKQTGEHLFLAMVHSQLLLVEQELLIGRLEPVEAGYDLHSRCMEGTRQSILDQLMDWATKGPRQQESNSYWIYGSPGVGKTALAHSICASLHRVNHLAGSFFCQRDDASLSEPRTILPTLIYKLAVAFPPFRRLVATRLRHNPNLTAGSMNASLFLELIRTLPHVPNHTLVFVIDAIDECGDALSRPRIMRALTDAAARAPWLKIIITSRPEVDIHHSFGALSRSSHVRYDLGTDREASADLQSFAQSQFCLVAERWYLSTPWPEPSLLNLVISRAAGLFIFIETIARALDHCKDPTEALRAMLEDTGLKFLYGLYSNIIKAQIVHSDVEFLRVIEVLLTTPGHRPLCEETISELAGVRPNLVKKWVDDLSSLLYRDERANGRIRVRHLSVSDFFLSDNCPSDYHVDLRVANMHLGIACLHIMISQLRFNICNLEDSRLANMDIKDLALRIQQNISDALQYSSLHWSNHLCFSDRSDQRVWESLRKFFEGPYVLFWIEVLSIMGMIQVGVPSLRRVISTMVKVSSSSHLQLAGKSNLV